MEVTVVRGAVGESPALVVQQLSPIPDRRQRELRVAQRCPRSDTKVTKSGAGPTMAASSSAVANCSSSWKPSSFRADIIGGRVHIRPEAPISRKSGSSNISIWAGERRL